MNLKNVGTILLLIILAGAIALSPSFSFGKIPSGKEIEIRVEDILIIFLGFLMVYDILIKKKGKIEKPPLFFSILIWVSIGFLSTLTNLAFGELSLSRGFFYFLKELEFFIFYFYVFYSINKLKTAKTIVWTWIFLGFINILYILYQIISGSYKGEYALAAICERGVFPTGSFFSIIFIFLFNIFIYYFLKLKVSLFKKIGLGILIFSFILGALGSGSQTILLTIILSLFLTLFFYFLKNKKIIPFLILTLIIFIISVIIFNLMVSNIIEIARIKNVLSFEDTVDLYLIKRWDDVIKPVFLKFFSEISFLDVILGRGKGYLGESHNQFVRNFIETGIIGSVAFLILMANILKILFSSYLRRTDNFSVGVCAGLIVSTLIMLFFAVGTEPFIVVKLASVYWFFAGITMAVLRLKNNHQES